MIPAALLAATPKCILCVLAWTGLAAALGVSGPELCGGAAGGTFPWLLVLSAAGAVIGALVFRRS